MKKILFGLLIVGALSACSSSEKKKMDIPMEVKTLNETVTTQTQEYESLKAEVEDLKMQTESLKMMQTQE